MRLLITLILFTCLHASGQDSLIIINGGTIHTGNGQVISNGSILIRNGKIAGVYQDVKMDLPGSRRIDASGKHIYPGLIACNTILGLNEIDAVRATRDYHETGNNNAGVRSLIAFNTDSRILPTVLSNGILLAQVAPYGGFVSGLSSVVKLNAWNWQDAAYAADNGVHLFWPSSLSLGTNAQQQEEQRKSREAILLTIQQFFQQSSAYVSGVQPAEKNLRYEGMRNLFEGKAKLYIHVDDAPGIVAAVNFAAQYKLKIVLIGARDAFLVTSLLKTHNVEVIITRTHMLPKYEDDPYDQPYSMPAILKKAGIPFAISDVAAWEQRNVPFQAGTAVGFGLSAEDALMSITLDAARILGISDRTGSLEAGKDANIIISEGDILDYRTSIVTMAFLQGLELNLSNHQLELYLKFYQKYFPAK